MCVIGVTGSLGSGKSTVTAMFKDLGANVIDADKIAHQQITRKGKCFRAVVKMFGKDILKRGVINRKKIAARVFQDIRLLHKLEGIIHPAVRHVILKKIRQFKRAPRKTVIILDVPLLFESKFNYYVDTSIVVKATKSKQMQRAIKLLGITKAEVERRLKAQMPLRQKIRLADMIIDNNGTLTQTKKQVKRIWEKL